MPTRFEEIIGNPRIFKTILDEVLHDTPGVYGIMPADDPSRRMFESSQGFIAFCRKLRDNEDGLRLCIGDDVKNSMEAKARRKPYTYTCHAGLVNIAIPIIVGDELVATIFWGQGRSKEKKVEKQAIEKANLTEAKLGFQVGELQKLRAKTPVLSDAQIESVTGRLWEFANYISSLGSSKLEVERTRNLLAKRLVQSESIQTIILELSGILEDIEEFWKRLDLVMVKICKIIGADSGLFIIHELTLPKNEVIETIRSVANLPNTLKGKQIPIREELKKSITELTPALMKLTPSLLSFIAATDLENSPSINDGQNMISVPVVLEHQKTGAMLFFVRDSQDKSKDLDVREELSLLTQASTYIATAYGNCLLYQKQREIAEIQSDWLENVSHQILAPITGILGQAENLSRSYKTWQKTNPERIDNTLASLIELADWTNRQARNFAWVAKTHNNLTVLNLRIEDDFPSLLVSYARNLEGAARSREITRIHVNTSSFKQLNGKLSIDNKLFKQAVTNLLDNAVKYADARTEINIVGEKTATQGLIKITNIGVPLHESDVEKIFDRYYRTEAAKMRYSIGSGIGLGLSREVIRLHGGDLFAIPSTQTDKGWKTTFVICLPLKEEANNG